jgi:hypothetical protein
MKNIDLTTAKGFEMALSLLESEWGWTLFPSFKLAKMLVDWATSPSDVSPEKQAEAAERIIRAGREHGAKRIKMKVDKTVGAKLHGNIEGADVSGCLGSDGKMELEIEYK